VKAAEVASVLLGEEEGERGAPTNVDAVAHRAVRLELFARAEDPRTGGLTHFSPMDLARARRPPPPPAARPAPVALAADAE
jgi:hypothetical protein